MKERNIVWNWPLGMGAKSGGGGGGREQTNAHIKTQHLQSSAGAG